MARYIDADALTAAIKRLSLGETDIVKMHNKIMTYINSMPTINISDDITDDIEYWHKKAKSYERTILKLCEAIGKQDDRY